MAEHISNGIGCISIANSAVPSRFVFMASNGRTEVGKLTWGKDGMTFEGDADESAQRFFAALGRQFNLAVDEACRHAVAEYIKSQQP